MVRRLALLMVLVPLVMLLNLPASSAGGSWLEVTGGQRARIDSWDLSYAAVGGTVSMRSEFSNGQLAPVSAGPWFAYLRSDVDGAMQVPLLLGSMDIATTGGYPYVATTSFAVPDVSTGYYSVTVCDLGCEQVGVGDLIGGNFFVGSTSREARLGARLQILRWIHQGEARAIDRLDQQLRDARLDLDDAEVASARATARAASAAAEAEATTATNERLAEQLNGRDEALDRWRWATWALAATLLASAALVVRMARRPRLVFPDTPAELIEEGGSPPSRDEVSTPTWRSAGPHRSLGIALVCGRDPEDPAHDVADELLNSRPLRRPSSASKVTPTRRSSASTPH